VKVYRSKTDAWLVAIIAFSANASLFGAINEHHYCEDER
jgi:hypothetical protein